MSRTFDKGFLKEIAWEEYDGSVVDVVQSEQVGSRRWVSEHESIFLMDDDGKYYRTTYDLGLTECQDSEPYEYEDDEIECDEVEPIEVTKTIYKTVGE